MKALLDSIAWLFRSRKAQPLQIVGSRMLAGGAALYAADIDGHRIVFATAPSAISVLAHYPVPARADVAQTQKTAGPMAASV